MPRIDSRLLAAISLKQERDSGTDQAPEDDKDPDPQANPSPLVNHLRTRARPRNWLDKYMGNGLLQAEPND